MRARRLTDERGSTAAEFAVAVPAVLLVLAAMLGGIQLGTQQLRLQDAAADAARSLGRGEPGSALAASISRQTPGASSTVTRAAGLVCVQLSAPAAALAGLVGVHARASSCALDET